jgi:carotenoid cleavage dioxygenase-like enzyme
VAKTWRPTPISWTGDLPQELYGGMYVRNGGNPNTNSDLGREAHWFDGDGMLTGVWFERAPTDSRKATAHFVNQFILTDVYMSSVESSTLRTPILPSIATLVSPVASLFWIVWRIMRTVFIVLLSHLSKSGTTIKRISVANTSVLFHDARALAACESGPPMRVTLPGLETVGWFDGNSAEGEPKPEALKDEQGPTLGGTGPLSWMREWTTGHPKVDNDSGELVLFHCSFAPPYVQYSLIPATGDSSSNPSPIEKQHKIVNAAVPGSSGGKLMHDFGVSKHHTVILDLPLTLTPFNLVKNQPVVAYEPDWPSRFGVFPRRHPEAVRWFETSGCCIFHTANTWDEYDSTGEAVAVNLLACRLTSASVVFSAGNIVPPPHPNHKKAKKEQPMSFFAKYDSEDEQFDLEKEPTDESSPLLTQEESAAYKGGANPFGASASVPLSIDDEEQCRLYYYRFSLDGAANIITHQFALSSIPVEFPTVSPATDMKRARYIYGCSTADESFGSALGKATKIDVLVRYDVEALLAQAQKAPPEAVTGCVDNRTLAQVLASEDPNDPIKAFQLPPKHYAQEARFVPRAQNKTCSSEDTTPSEADGYLLFYVFDESQLDGEGECGKDAKSELWVLDAKSMERVVCKVQLPTRVPYGLHGNWFTEEQIKSQRAVESVRSLSDAEEDAKDVGRWDAAKQKLLGCVG